MRILVVDDDDDSQKQAMSILDQGGYTVLSVASCKDAISLLERNETVDIILSDISMPVMDGFHLLSFLKTDIRFEHIPVILCTAVHDEASVRKALTLGAIDYILKPVQADTLLPKVKKAEASVPGAILVVDNELLLRNLLSNILRREGLKVITAESGEAALRVLENEKVALVLSDTAMPEMTDLQLLVEIKEKYKTVPVVLVTGRIGQFTRESVQAAGGDGYITKPFKSTEIMNVIRQLTSQRARRNTTTG